MLLGSRGGRRHGEQRVGCGPFQRWRRGRRRRRPTARAACGDAAPASRLRRPPRLEPRDRDRPLRPARGVAWATSICVRLRPPAGADCACRRTRCRRRSPCSACSCRGNCSRRCGRTSPCRRRDGACRSSTWSATRSASSRLFPSFIGFDMTPGANWFFCPTTSQTVSGNLLGFDPVHDDRADRQHALGAGAVRFEIHDARHAGVLAFARRKAAAGCVAASEPSARTLMAGKYRAALGIRCPSGVPIPLDSPESGKERFATCAAICCRRPARPCHSPPRPCYWRDGIAHLRGPCPPRADRHADRDLRLRPHARFGDGIGGAGRDPLCRQGRRARARARSGAEARRAVHGRPAPRRGRARSTISSRC